MTVIYIMASSHSGSTILSYLLGAHEKVSNLGELKEFECFFDPWVTNDKGQYNSPCDCGQYVYECPFWSSLHNQKPLNHVKADNIELYNLIRQNVEEPVLVDNSKIPEKFEFYKRNNIPYVIVHLVRDGRARAYSEQKLGRDYEYALKKWSQRNIQTHEMHGNDPNYILVNYEDLVVDPVNTLQSILSMAGLQAHGEQLDYQDEEFHSIGGNRKVRFNRPRLRFDTEYIKALSKEQFDKADKLIGGTLRFFDYFTKNENR